LLPGGKLAVPPDRIALLLEKSGQLRRIGAVVRGIADENVRHRCLRQLVRQSLKPSNSCNCVDPSGGLFLHRHSHQREGRSMRIASYVALVVLPFAMIQTNALAQQQQGGPAALLETYPDFLERIDGNELAWKDGTRMRIDDGKGEKTL